MPIYKSDQELSAIAVSLWPDSVTSDTAAVLHNRRKWVESVTWLRDRKEGSHWCLDKSVARRPAAVTPPQWTAFAVLQRQINRSKA